jgi:uncharacterized membrane protein YbhN (UPF0104 family)
VSVTSPQPWDLSGFVRQIAPAGGGAAPARLRRLVLVLTLVAGGFAVALVSSHGRDFADALGHALRVSWGLVVAGALLEVASVAGYVLLLHRVVSGASPRLRWRDSYDIALAGTAVTRLLPTAGLGGAAVTVWALRAHGVRTRELAERLLAFLVLLYAVYMAALVASGVAVALGLVNVPHGRGLGILAAGGGSAIIAAVVGVLAAPGPLGRLGAGRSGRLGTLAGRTSSRPLAISLSATTQSRSRWRARLARARNSSPS